MWCAEADEDNDGVCDDEDDCVGELDACGVCNGPGAVNDADATTSLTVPAIASNEPDALGECGGACEADEDNDGVCDDEDDCVGELDACGVCNGPGAVNDCGAKAFLRETAIAMATSSMLWVYAEEVVLPTKTVTASATRR